MLTRNSVQFIESSAHWAAITGANDAGPRTLTRSLHYSQQGITSVDLHSFNRSGRHEWRFPNVHDCYWSPSCLKDWNMTTGRVGGHWTIGEHCRVLHCRVVGDWSESLDLGRQYINHSVQLALQRSHTLNQTMQASNWISKHYIWLGFQSLL